MNATNTTKNSAHNELLHCSIVLHESNARIQQNKVVLLNIESTQ